MSSGTYEYQSDFAKKHQALGRAEGKAEGEAKAVLILLEARGLVVSPEERALVLACGDLPTLDRWIRLAATATTTKGLFEP